MEQTLNLRDSSNLSGATYDRDTQVLTVTFKSGHSGQHPGITEDEALAFERADSPGKHYHQFFKAAGKTYNKLG